MKKKTVVITGGASGIGLAMVKKFATELWSVFFIDTNQAEGEKVEKELKEKGYSVAFLNCNITQTAAVKALFAAIPGKIDTLINNAGISHIGKVENTSEEDF
jgi:2-keto-3-deoxy-L-fuconate dehydrogenase